MRTRRYAFVVIIVWMYLGGIQNSWGAVDPNNLEQACMAGVEFEKQSQYDNAITIYGEVIAKCPATPQAQFCRARTATAQIQKAINSGNYAEARQYAQTLRTEFADMKDSADWICSAGIQFETKAQYDDAIVIYHYIVEKYPTSAEAQFSRLHAALLQMQTAFNSEDYEQARQNIQTLKTDCADAQGVSDNLCWAGCQFEIKGHYDDALAIYRHIVEKYPTSKESPFARARVASLQLTNSINSGNYEQARQYAQTLKTDFKTVKEIPDQLYWAGCQFLIKSLHKDANDIFNTIVTDYAGTKAAKYAAAQLLAGRVVPAIEQLSDEGLSSALTALQGNSLAKDAETVALAKFFIAEACFEVGMRHSQPLLEPNNVFFIRSLSLFEAEATGIIKNTETNATVWYMIGLNCDKLSRYLKASQAFAKAYSICPNHPHADYLLFAQGYCYEKLLEQKAVSEADAKTIITTQYSRLISTFGQSQYASYAKSWVEKNSK